MLVLSSYLLYSIFITNFWDAGVFEDIELFENRKLFEKRRQLENRKLLEKRELLEKSELLEKREPLKTGEAFEKKIIKITHFSFPLENFAKVLNYSWILWTLGTFSFYWFQIMTAPLLHFTLKYSTANMRKIEEIITTKIHHHGKIVNL